MVKELKLSPSYLFLGSEHSTETIAKQFIKKVFCGDLKNQNGYCDMCIECNKVDRKVHHGIIWLKPEGQYTTSDLEPIFNSIAFALADQQHFFFVISKAHQLSQVCGNSLLKLMEEPPQGYHFILTAQAKERLLPTILSRCIVQNYAAESEFNSIFFNYFIKLNDPDFIGFNQALQSIKMSEHDLMLLLDQIFRFWMDKLKMLFDEKNNDDIESVQRILDLINKSRADAIMPGSGKIFLRNLYMQFILRHVL